MSEISREDVKILDRLQADGRITNASLADAVSMSASPCWRRVRQLEEDGVIQGYSANLDRRKIGLGVLVYVTIQIDNHSDEDASRFERQIQELPEVISCHSVSGGADFMLMVVSRDLDAYAEFSMTILRRLPGIKTMTTNFALKEIKPFKGLPLGL
ncbi:MAG: Lrp/AsnC family transcriptional regulator [Roseibium sp.]|uniref:Lrp/AsnC family transcriptional regulator n=1 Tax=Roseibium sp. TaxID=1936156 RepID=UPI001B09A9ED|nr:Lrp/AsnC family transcriptional regulator [Roseibium sp.]MBO6891177.1 Lrp/AsnC family transcriptional regulator [Roseibium sp.]MBO6928782.1 Lrp/AsnC family transcriptional regulator [Roseibium sp.]